jgi:Fur family transcriptional regulator, peroxide stress response regulator
MKSVQIIDLLNEKGLKITPQRTIVYEAVLKVQPHPTADQVIQVVRKKNPNISPGTIYKTLETFVQNGIIRKVKTDADIMRYDPVTDKHHHLYCAESERIEDYFDEELNSLIENYFKKKKIPHFDLQDFKLQLVGQFTNTKS